MKKISFILNAREWPISHATAQAIQRHSKNDIRANQAGSVVYFHQKRVNDRKAHRLHRKRGGYPRALAILR